MTVSSADGYAVPAGSPARGTAARVGVVLDALVRRRARGAGARDLAAELGISRSSVHRILQALSELRVARVRGDGRYGTGGRMVAWAGFLRERHPMLRYGRDAISALSAATGETALLVSYTPPDPDGVTIASSECDKPVRYMVPVGTPTPLHAGSAGRAILAQLPPEVLQSLERPRLTAATIRDLAELRAEVDRARQLGYASTIGERFPEAAGASAAFLRAGEVAGAVTLTIPRERLDTGTLAAHGQLVSDVAAGLTRRLQGLVTDQVGTDHTDVRASAPETSQLYERWSARHREVGDRAEGRAVARVVCVLDAVCRSPAGLPNTAELAAAVRARTSTVRGLLHELASRRIVASTSEDRWEAGPRMLAMLGSLEEGDLLVRISRDVLREVGSRTGETACLVSYDSSRPTDEALRFEAVHESEKPIRYVISVGSLAPLHAGAAGKAVLGQVGTSQLGRRSLRRYTQSTIVDADALARDLDATRERGYALSDGERIAEAVGVAAPYFCDGAVAGSLTVTIPRSRFDHGDVPSLAAAVRDAAQEITLLLSAR